MLKGVSPLISPELLVVLHQMGHGDEIVLADAHFPAHSLGRPVIRADGLGVDQLLGAILPLFELDEYVDVPLLMMRAVKGDRLDPAVEKAYRTAIDRHAPGATIGRIDRFAFYDRARSSFAIVSTGETRKYGNILLKKGVTPLS
jgi:L-fucose mutarotase